MLDLEAVGTRRPAAGPQKLTRAEAGCAEEVPLLGLILMRADGRPELVDDQAVAWLGVPAEGLDAATFEILTGVDPALMLGGAPRLSFTLNEPRPLIVTMWEVRQKGGVHAARGISS
jgi:hypothetical protein